MLTIFFDTETTGFPKRNLPLDDKGQPNMVQLAAILADEKGEEMASMNCIIKPNGWEIPESASNIHGITTDMAKECGIRLDHALDFLGEMALGAKVVVAHNIPFDLEIIDIQSRKVGRVVGPLSGYGIPMEAFCTMTATTPLCKLPGKYGDYKWPKLIEAYRFLFNEDFADAHDALADVRACMRIYFELQKRKEAVQS